jgi:outer membrane protein TolC
MIRMLFIFGAVFGVSGWLAAQSSITLSQCYDAARQHHPERVQWELQQKIGAIRAANISKIRHLPQLSLNGQATLQSEVTSLPIELPNIKITPLSKDQYKLTLDANYLLYDGGAATLQSEIQTATAALEQQKINVDLNKVNDMVNAYYFGALLTDENIRLTQILQKDLRERIDRLNVNVKYGTAIPTSVDQLEAKFLKADQRLAELDATRAGYRAVLALLTGLNIDATTVLELPSAPADQSAINRPEFQLFELQNRLLDTQVKLLDNQKLPRLSAFFQTGYGRPALNFLNNNFRGLAIGGIRFTWNLAPFYTFKNEQNLIQINREVVASQRSVFDYNLSIQMRQQQTEIDKLNGVIAKDRQIIQLRGRIKNNATAQLDKGIITANDYVTEANAENQAQLNLALHELQLLMAKIQYKTLSGL